LFDCIIRKSEGFCFAILEPSVCFSEINQYFIVTLCKNFYHKSKRTFLLFHWFVDKIPFGWRCEFFRLCFTTRKFPTTITTLQTYCKMKYFYACTTIYSYECTSKKDRYETRQRFGVHGDRPLCKLHISLYHQTNHMYNSTIYKCSFRLVLESDTYQKTKKNWIRRLANKLYEYWFSKFSPVQQ
jgi:hypothetical protein